MANGNQAEKLYRIRYPDGSFRTEGRAETKGRVKTWRKPGHVKAHLRVGSERYESPDEVLRRTGTEEAEVVEYELREVRRIPVRELFEAPEEE